MLSHTERAPNAQELLSDGEHVATRSYEVGDPRLSTESAWNLELNWHYSGPIDAQLSLFHRRFGDFIYAADTGLRFSHDRHDAGFTGVDACSNALAEFDNEEDVFASAPTCFAYQQADAR